jgi:carbon-monoxide dehydrogenase small subunit
MTTVRLTVNGAAVSRDVENRTLLVELLRDHLGLTGTHVGCDTSQCGCCTVLVDGAPAKSCTVLAVQADSASVTTVEGLARGESMHPIQQAFVDCHGLQCGFCTPGMMMAAAGLLAKNDRPTDAEIVHALEGNLCRCTGYVNIIAAVRQAAGVMAAEGKQGGRP